MTSAGCAVSAFTPKAGRCANPSAFGALSFGKAGMTRCFGVPWHIPGGFRRSGARRLGGICGSLKIFARDDTVEYGAVGQGDMNRKRDGK